MNQAMEETFTRSETQKETHTAFTKIQNIPK